MPGKTLVLSPGVPGKEESVKVRSVTPTRVTVPGRGEVKVYVFILQQKLERSHDLGEKLCASKEQCAGAGAAEEVDGTLSGAF